MVELSKNSELVARRGPNGAIVALKNMYGTFDRLLGGRALGADYLAIGASVLTLGAVALGFIFSADLRESFLGPIGIMSAPMLMVASFVFANNAAAQAAEQSTIVVHERA